VRPRHVRGLTPERPRSEAAASSVAAGAADSQGSFGSGLAELVDGRWELSGQAYRDLESADDAGRARCEQAPVTRVYYVKRARL
jgi:hypothetical protein